MSAQAPAVPSEMTGHIFSPACHDEDLMRRIILVYIFEARDHLSVKIYAPGISTYRLQLRLQAALRTMTGVGTWYSKRSDYVMTVTPSGTGYSTQELAGLVADCAPMLQGVTGAAGRPVYVLFAHQMLAFARVEADGSQVRVRFPAGQGIEPGSLEQCLRPPLHDTLAYVYYVDCSLDGTDMVVTVTLKLHAELTDERRQDIAARVIAGFSLFSVPNRGRPTKVIVPEPPAVS